MSRRLRHPPTYAQAAQEFEYSATHRTLYRLCYAPAFEGLVTDDSQNLLQTWPQTLCIAGQQWPFLKVVFLLHYKRWPEGAVSYPCDPCDPSQILEAQKPQAPTPDAYRPTLLDE